MFTLRSISNRFPKRAFTSIILVSVAFLASASMGGGGNKSKNKAVRGTEFTPIRTTNGFTLKAGPTYRGSFIYNQDKVNNVISFNTVVTYQKGNTTYIIPCKYKVQTAVSPANSNLQLFNLKFKMHK